MNRVGHCEWSRKGKMKKRIHSLEPRKVNIRWCAHEWAPVIRYAAPVQNGCQLIIESAIDTDFLLRRRARKKPRKQNEFSVWAVRNGNRASWR
jgi:hypothetical protein